MFWTVEQEKQLEGVNEAATRPTHLWTPERTVTRVSDAFAIINNNVWFHDGSWQRLRRGETRPPRVGSRDQRRFLEGERGAEGGELNQRRPPVESN